MEIKGLNNPVLIDLAILALTLFVVHGIYVMFIHPQSIEIIQAAESTGVYPARNPIIIVKDFEQEICIVLAIWCIGLLISRYRFTDVDIHLLEADFTGAHGLATSIGQIDEKIQEAEEVAPGSIVVLATKSALETFMVGKSLVSAKNAAFEYCDLQEEILESKLTTIRYILWAIPSIGFLGTVRGIGEALTRANEAVQGDISGVASSLGVAFNSTFVALLVSLGLTMINNGLRGREQERLVKCKTFISGTLMLQLKRSELGPDAVQIEEE